MRFNVRSNSKEVLAKLKGKEALLTRAVGISLKRMGQEARSMAIGMAPRKTGDLVRSILMTPAFPLKYVSIGSNKVYARIQDLGGVVTPKAGKYLTIPLPGVRGRIRTHAGGFFIRSKAGNLLYVKKQGSGIKPLFVLKEKVNIKGTKYLTATFEYFKRSRSKEIVGEEVAHVLKSI